MSGTPVRLMPLRRSLREGQYQMPANAADTATDPIKLPPSRWTKTGIRKTQEELTPRWMSPQCGVRWRTLRDPLPGAAASERDQ